VERGAEWDTAGRLGELEWAWGDMELSCRLRWLVGRAETLRPTDGQTDLDSLVALDSRKIVRCQSTATRRAPRNKALL
jgi:hypothetical protein